MRRPTLFAAAWLLCAVSVATAQEKPTPLSSEDTRLTAGVESAGSSSQPRQQHMLIDFMLTAPLSGGRVERLSKPWLGAWLNARFNGTTTTSIAGVKQFVGGFEQSLIAGGTSSLLNQLTLRGGVEVSLSNGFDFGGNFQFEPLLLVGFGFTTPPPTETPATFELSSEARGRWPDIPLQRDGKDVQYVAFVEPDRKRFYQSWEVGVRLKSHHFAADRSGLADGDTRLNFPGVIDITVGQNSAITGGIRRGLAATVEAFYPLPTDDLSNAIYFFGSAHLQSVTALDHLVEQAPIILKGAAATVAIPSPEVWIQTLTPDDRTRDDWRFGVGIDLVRLITGAQKKRDEEAAAALAEKGCSYRKFGDTADVEVYRVVQQPSEACAFNHGNDILLPLTSSTLTANFPGGRDTVPFTQGTFIAIAGVRRELTNNSPMTTVEFLRVKLKLRGAAAERARFSPDVEKDLPNLTEKAYVVSRATCAMKCTLTSDVDNTLVVIPISGKAQTKIAEKAGAVWTTNEPFVVPRKDKLEITSEAALDFYVIRIL